MPPSKCKRGAFFSRLNAERSETSRAMDCSGDDPGDEDYHDEENEQDGNSDDDVMRDVEPEGRAAPSMDPRAIAERERKRAKKRKQRARTSTAIVRIALSQSLDELPEELRDCPDLPVSPLFKQRRWARISWQYAREYRKGTGADSVFQAVMAQRTQRHRDTSDSRMRQVEARMEMAAFAAMG